MRISDWSSDVCSSDLSVEEVAQLLAGLLLHPVEIFLARGVAHRVDGRPLLDHRPQLLVAESLAQLVPHQRRAVVDVAAPELRRVFVTGGTSLLALPGLRVGTVVNKVIE